MTNLWVLKDDRPGNYNQAINLAQCLEYPYEIKEISYNILAKFPNLLKFGKFSTINQESKNNLLNQNCKPSIIISAGRRSALIAIDLKKIYPEVFLINIMNPGNSLIKKFDLVIAPKHDEIKGDNIIEILGSITKINKELIQSNVKEFENVFNKIKSPKIALLIGGSSKSAKYSLQDAKNLRNITDNICKNMKAKLIVSTSRRTDDFVINELERDNKNIQYLFKWQKDKKNPYLAILDNADFIIVTGDSISMCCEACGFGKPVYIYANKNICPKKHLKFQHSLFELGYAKELKNDILSLSNRKSEKLDESSILGEKIKKILKS